MGKAYNIGLACFAAIGYVHNGLHTKATRVPVIMSGF